MINVLHVAPTFARAEGGPSEVLRGLLPVLERDGEVSTVLVASDKFADASDADLARSENVFSYHCYGKSNWTFTPALLLSLPRFIKNADIVHIHSIHTFTTTLALILCKALRRRAILQPHGALNKYHFRKNQMLKLIYLKLVDRFGLNCVERVIYSSTREMAEGIEILPKTTGVIVPLGVDSDLFTTPRIEEGESLYVLYLGRVAKKKRVDLVLESFARLDGLPHAKLLIAGPIDHDLDFDINDLVKHLGISDRTQIVGQVDSATRRRLLSSARAFVLPSEDESFGIAAAEAMAAGCAVLTTTDVGLAVDASREAALTIITRDPDEIANALRVALADEAWLQNSHAARRYAEQNFTWESVANRVRSLYDHSIETSGTQA